MWSQDENCMGCLENRMISLPKVRFLCGIRMKTVWVVLKTG